MKIGQKIKECRKTMGLTQTELGEMLGVQKNAVSKWECGRVEDIPRAKIKAMANIFGVPTSYLIDDVISRKTDTDDLVNTILDEAESLPAECKQRLLSMARQLNLEQKQDVQKCT